MPIDLKVTCQSVSLTPLLPLLLFRRMGCERGWRVYNSERFACLQRRYVYERSPLICLSDLAMSIKVLLLTCALLSPPLHTLSRQVARVPRQPPPPAADLPCAPRAPARQGKAARQHFARQRGRKADTRPSCCANSLLFCLSSLELFY